MKLLKLKINDKFKSISAESQPFIFYTGEEEDLQKFAPYCLVGRNGCGKSNILEALSAIFYHLSATYLDNVPEDFHISEENPHGYFDSNISTPDAYELEYIVALPLNKSNNIPREFEPMKYTPNPESGNFWVEVRIVKEKDKRAIISIKNETRKGLVIITTSEDDLSTRFSRDKNDYFILTDRKMAQEVLLDYIIGYSSGENETLSLPFYKMRFINYDEYVERLFNPTDNYILPEGRMVYVDVQYSQAILLANFLFQDKETKDLAPFEQELGLKTLKEFRFTINKELFAEVNMTEKIRRKTEAQNPEDAEVELPLYTNLEEKVLTPLKNCATTWFEDDKQFIFDFFVDDATHTAFKDHFHSAIQFFEYLNLLQILNLWFIESLDSTFVEERDGKEELSEASLKIKETVYKSDDAFIKELIPTAPVYDQFFRISNLKFEKDGIDELLNIKSLSDGEHQFLHTLGICLLLKDQNALFLLDEPETHFNPDWRAKFISTLKECFDKSEGNVLRDLLITTHSPFILSDCKREQVLWFHKKGQAVRPPIETFGTSVEIITADLFDKEDSIADLSKTYIGDLKKKVASGEILPDDALKIAENLGESVEKTLLVNFIIKEKKKS